MQEMVMIPKKRLKTLERREKMLKALMRTLAIKEQMIHFLQTKNYTGELKIEINAKADILQSIGDLFIYRLKEEGITLED